MVSESIEHTLDFKKAAFHNFQAVYSRKKSHRGSAMSKALKASWTCFRCLRRQQQFIHRRHLATATATTTTIPSSLSLVGSSNGNKHDDTTLRQIFDLETFWQGFIESGRDSWGGKRVGLFQNHHLNSPQGFGQFAESTIRKCQKLVERVIACSSIEDYKSIVQYLDRLSDLLCRVIDMSDFVRSTHPDPSFQHAATAAHSRMIEYMNTLNTTTGLHDQLQVALKQEDVTSAWTEEEHRVARILEKDFSQSAIDLPEEKRQQFVTLANRINDIGSRFLDTIQPQKFHLRVGLRRLEGVDPRLVKQYTDISGNALLPTAGPVASQILNSAHDEFVREEMYTASRNAAKKQVQMLEDLMRARAELAQLSGFDSYASMALSDKMARSPEAVSKFLDALAADNKGSVEEEIARLRKLKREKTGVDLAQLNAWDRDYYRSRLVDTSTKPSRNADFLPAFFSLGTVMQGLSRLFNSLYGVRFKPVEPLPGETWSSEVRRLDVVNDNDERIAIVYCDLFARKGKSPNPAHFTVRCSRLITASEISELSSPDSASLARPPHLRGPVDPIALANDGMATTVLPSGSAYQLPTIALICDFPPPASLRTPPLLPASQLTTLFHEMGHAIHSILGRTTLQGVSGTRCATDFAELPSILMEHFATDPAVLALYARHWDTNEPLSENLALQIQRSALAAETPREGAADTEWQIILSLLDQAYHSPLAAVSKRGDFDSTAIAHDIYARYSSVPEPRGTRWQGFFGHLVGYGGSYYSYLFDRAIAARVWEVVFASGRGGAAVQRERGERFKEEVLGRGGAREPWKCVAGVLGDGRLEDGGEGAMEVVGSWGVRR